MQQVNKVHIDVVTCNNNGERSVFIYFFLSRQLLAGVGLYFILSKANSYCYKV